MSLIFPLGPVDLTLAHTLITIAKQACVLPQLRGVGLPIGEYAVQGDVRPYITDPYSRRLQASGILAFIYVADPLAAPVVPALPIDELLTTVDPVQPVLTTSDPTPAPEKAAIDILAAFGKLRATPSEPDAQPVSSDPAVWVALGVAAPGTDTVAVLAGADDQHVSATAGDVVIDTGEAPTAMTDTSFTVGAGEPLVGVSVDAAALDETNEPVATDVAEVPAATELVAAVDATELVAAVDAAALPEPMSDVSAAAPEPTTEQPVARRRRVVSDG